MVIQDVYKELEAAQSAHDSLHNLETQAARLPELKREAARLASENNLDAIALEVKRDCEALEKEIALEYTTYQAKMQALIDNLYTLALQLTKIRNMEAKLRRTASRYLGACETHFNLYHVPGYGEIAALDNASKILSRPLRPLESVPPTNYGIGTVMQNLLAAIRTRGRQ